ncbi:MAG: ATP-binding protein [Gemmatimonadetes bacterium]|nr:ATP-binding protein [Gemmatimonadota bacterium]
MTRPEPIILSWSGGKDSALALARLRADPRFQVTDLLTTVTAGYDRVSIHGVRRALLHAQAAALGLPVHEATLQPESSNQAYDAALARALAALRERQPAVRRVAFGDIFLQDVRQYREERIAAAGLEGLFPLWGEPTHGLAREGVDRGIRARLVCVDTHALSAGFAGRAYDAVLLAELPEGIDPCGERGEFHTFVSDGPGFRAPVPYRVGQVVMRGERFAYCDLVPDGAGDDESGSAGALAGNGSGATAPEGA